MSFEVLGQFLSYDFGLALLLIIVLSAWILKLQFEIRVLKQKQPRSYLIRTAFGQLPLESALPKSSGGRPTPPPPPDLPESEEPKPPAADSVDAPDPVPSQIPEPSTAVAPPVEPPFSAKLAQERYAEWCHASVRPSSTSNTTVAFVQYARAEPAKEFGGAATHVLRDAAQVAEFVRFSEAGSKEALVFPTPEAHFTPVMNHLFPGLTAAAMDTPAAMANIAPVHMRRRSATEWERDD